MSAPSSTIGFLATMGVNVHVEYTDGKYADTANVIADLKYLGETNVRDAVLNPSNQGQASYDTLAQAGIKFDLFFQGSNLTSTLSLVDAFLKRNPGAVSLIEGPNEVNNFPISYASLTGNAAATAYQAALNMAVKMDAALKGVPVADLTSYPFLAGPSDDANYHFYPLGGQQPGVAYGTSLSDLSALEQGKPLVMTEGGYNTLLTDSYFGGVDQLTQAKLTLNLYCDNAKAGVQTTYIYQLLDAYADPTNSNSDSHFGLFNLDNSPKLAATAIHNLTSILSSGADGSAAAGALAFESSGLPTTGGLLDLVKNSSTHDLVIWSEPTIWNGATKTEVAASGSPTTLHFDALQNVRVFDPLVGSSPVATYASVHDVIVTAVDHPLIVEVQSAPQPALQAAPATLNVPAGNDFDGDKKADILWRNANGDVVTWLSANGGSKSVDLGVVDSGWTIAGTGDFDGDAKADILWRNANGDVVTWLSTHGGSVSTDLGIVDKSWTIAGTGDFDGDGKADILWRNANGDVVTWLSTHGGSSGVDLGKVDSGWAIAGTGDFDGDGKADILWRNANGDVVTWLSTHGGSSGVDLGKVDSGWTIAGTGDFDGDGKADILWRNNNGDVVTWLSTHGGSSGVDLGKVDSSWTIAGTGDFDGDGKADILWRNTSSGELGAWESSHGVGASSYVSFGTVGLDWQTMASHS